MANMVFSSRIKSLRMERGLSLDKLARELDINKSRVGMWESNGTVPRRDILIKLSNYFEVSIDYLLGNDVLFSEDANNTKLLSLQRNLGKLNDAELQKAENMLKAVFAEIFEEGDDD